MKISKINGNASYASLTHHQLRKSDTPPHTTRICYNGNPKNEWESTITAFLPKELTSLLPKADYFEVSETTVQSGGDYKLALSKDKASISEMLNRFGGDDLIITGKLKDRNIELWFLRLYFRTT